MTRQRDVAPELQEHPLADEIEVISDGDGLAVLGAAKDVDAFLTSYGLDAAELEISRLGPKYKTAAGMFHVGSTAVANSGKWMKLADESYAATKLLPMIKNSTTGNFHATLRASNGQFAKNLQFTTSATTLMSPAALAGIGAIMSQMAMQEAIEEIGEYLAVIDEKVNDVLRAQKDAVLADMIGVDLVIEEAMTIRQDVGRVSEVTWSKVQGTALTIARTQAYALRQIDALAEKVDTASVSEIAAAAKAAEPKVREWLAVIARCVQLQDALAVLELDRVLDSEPEDREKHRRGVRTARDTRLATIHRATELLLERMNTAIRRANAKVLLSPRPARAAVSSSNAVVEQVLEFQTVLEIEDGHEMTGAKRWRTAAGEVRDKVVETGVEGAGAARQFGENAASGVRSGAGRLSTGVRAFRAAVRKDDSDPSPLPEADDGATLRE